MAKYMMVLSSFHPGTIYEHMCKAYHLKLLLSLKKCRNGDLVKSGSDKWGNSMKLHLIQV